MALAGNGGRKAVCSSGLEQDTGVSTAKLKWRLPRPESRLPGTLGPLASPCSPPDLYYIQPATKWLAPFSFPWLKLQGAIWLTGVLDLLTWGDRFMASRGWMSFSSHRVVWVVRSSSLGRPCPSWYVCLLNLTVFLITTKEKQNVLKIKKHYSLLYLIFDQNSPKCYFAFYVNLALNKL